MSNKQLRICAQCREQYMGTKVATYCPKCARMLTRSAWGHYRGKPIMPHWRE